LQSEHAQLARAFEAFNSLSSQLSSSYAALERRVAELSAELAAARSEQLRELRAKEALARRLSQLVEALPGGVVVLDGAGRVVEANAQARDMLGEPLVGASWDDVQRQAFAATALSGDRSLSDGRRVTLSVNRFGEAERIVLVSDVTESRRIQTELERKQRLTAMGEMVAGLAHQIRTPLAASLLYTEQLASNYFEGERRARIGTRLTGRLKHIERLINDMLVFARGDSADTETVSVHALFEDVQASVAPLLSAGVLGVSGDALETRLTVGREALVGALSNLVVNAIQAAGDSVRAPHLEALRETDGAVTLAVLDDGPGFDDVGRVFEPFFTTRSGGTGLGLAVVRAVAESHGGWAFAENRPERGARVGMRLPLTSRHTLLPSGTRPSARQEQSATR